MVEGLLVLENVNRYLSLIFVVFEDESSFLHVLADQLLPTFFLPKVDLASII